MPIKKEKIPDVSEPMRKKRCVYYAASPPVPLYGRQGAARSLCLGGNCERTSQYLVNMAEGIKGEEGGLGLF